MSIGSGIKSRLTVRTKIYKKDPFKNGDIIYIDELSKNNKGFWEVYRYHTI
jgi:hypothetical protein